MNLRAPTTRETLGGVAGVTLVVGVLAVFAPDVLPPALVDATATLERQVDAWIVVLVLSLVVFAYALYRFWRVDVGAVERMVDRGDEVVELPDLDAADVDFDPDRPGRAFDYAMARTVAQLDADPNADAWEADRIRGDLKTAVLAVRVGDDRDWQSVVREVDDGSWTTDEVAAAFLGGSDAPGVSLWRRVYAWLYPARAFRRRVERVVDEIERQAGMDDVPAATAVAESREGDESDGSTTDAEAHEDEDDPTKDDDTPTKSDDAPAKNDDAPAMNDDAPAMNDDAPDGADDAVAADEVGS